MTIVSFTIFQFHQLQDKWRKIEDPKIVNVNVMIGNLIISLNYISINKLVMILILCGPLLMEI